MPASKSRRLAAIMFTDIVGYTALMQQNEKAAAAVRNRHREVFQQYHETYHGEIVQYFGDGTLSTFQSGVQAVECAIAIQIALRQEPKVPLRIGLHLGDIVFDGTEIYGDGVNTASRIESMGTPGAILLSDKLNDELKNQQHITTQSVGAFEFKNVAQPIELFAVTNDGLPIPEPAEMKGKGKPKQEDKSIAVLPFVNMSSSEENEYFSDGMTEEIINALTKIDGLKVTSRTSSFHFKNKNIPVAQIGEALNVSTILEGSIRLAGNQMRITAQLIDVSDDVHFWSETFDRSLDNIFEVQDEVSLLIADKLREHLGHLEIGDHLIEAPDISVEAYKDYLKARFHMLKMTPGDLEKGLSMLEEVLTKHPNYTMAHLGIHLGYTLIGTIGLLPAEEAFMKGKPHLDKAIELDPELPECQLHLSWIAFLQQWDLPKAYQHLNKALEQKAVVDFYQSMAATLVAEGKFKAATNYIETAIQLDPFANINYHLKGFILYGQGNYEEALENYTKSLELKPDFMASTIYKGQTLILLGRKEEALNYFQNLSDDAGDLLKLGGMTMAQASLGNTAEAQKGIEQLEAALQTDLLERALNMLILCYGMLGDEEKMFQHLEKGIEYRLPMMVYLYVEPILESYWQHPRFKKLMAKIFGKKTVTQPAKRKYKKALFDQKELKQYRSQLDQLMTEQQPYLDPNLTLRDLAEQLDLPPNHMSQLLNEGFQQNFSEFVNTYRLDTFKQLAADPNNRHMTILGLAFDSGFNSKTVFNTFFKKKMGETPSAYWKAGKWENWSIGKLEIKPKGKAESK